MPPRNSQRFRAALPSSARTSCYSAKPSSPTHFQHLCDSKEHVTCMSVSGLLTWTNFPEHTKRRVQLSADGRVALVLSRPLLALEYLAAREGPSPLESDRGDERLRPAISGRPSRRHRAGHLIVHLCQGASTNDVIRASRARTSGFDMGQQVRDHDRPWCEEDLPVRTSSSGGRMCWNMNSSTKS